MSFGIYWLPFFIQFKIFMVLTMWVISYWNLYTSGIMLWNWIFFLNILF